MPVAMARAWKVAAEEAITCRQSVTARSQSPDCRSAAVRQARHSWAVGSRALVAQKLNAWS